MTRLALALVGAAVGYLAAAVRPAPRAPAPIVETRVVRVPAPMPPPVAPPPAEPPPPAPPHAEPAPEHRTAVEKGRTLVARAFTSGRWGDEEARDLRAVLPELSRAEHDELMASLVPAINDGRIAVTTDGPPF